jgi:hypothetical protein
MPVINISTSPTLIPIICTGGFVTLQEDDTNTTLFQSENNPPGAPVWITANDKVQTDQNLNVNLQWTMSGALNSFLNADYVCTAYFEKMGTGEATANFSVTISHFQSGSPHSYSVNIPVPAGSLNVGVYRLVVSVTTQSHPVVTVPPTPPIGFPIVGFCDCNLIQVYES